MSIAITVVCCALFFLFFAGYFLRTQEKLIEMQVRSEMQEARMNVLENNVLMLGQRVAVPPPPMPVGVVPAPAPVVPLQEQAAHPVQAVPAPVSPPPTTKHQSVAPSPVEVMGGAALLLNTESLTPALPKSMQKKPHSDKAEPKPKAKSEAVE